MPKFFVDKGQIDEQDITIMGEDTAHITRVLRMAQGDLLTVCDNDGTDYECEITTINKKEIICRINSSAKCLTEPNIEVTLFQCLPKAAKMEQIIQKCTELGISRIVPVLSKRCVAKEEKNERWEKVALEAAKQSGRGKVPVVERQINFKTAIERMSGLDCAIMPYEQANEVGLKAVLKKTANTVGILIGPEGGFDESEAMVANEKGINIVTLGKRILRTETAGSAVLAIVMYEIGDIGC